MSDYHYAFTYNTVRVDPAKREALLEYIKPFSATLSDNGDGSHYFDRINQLQGDIFESQFDEDDNEITVDYSHIATHLEPGQVLIVKHAGGENEQYVCGYAQAYSTNGEKVEINIEDIYRLAAKRFNVSEELISLA